MHPPAAPMLQASAEVLRSQKHQDDKPETQVTVPPAGNPHPSNPLSPPDAEHATSARRQFAPTEAPPPPGGRARKSRPASGNTAHGCRHSRTAVKHEKLIRNA